VSAFVSVLDVRIVIGRGAVLLWDSVFIYTVGARSAEVRAGWRQHGFSGRRDMTGEDEKEEMIEEKRERIRNYLIWTQSSFTVTICVLPRRQAVSGAEPQIGLIGEIRPENLRRRLLQILRYQDFGTGAGWCVLFRCRCWFKVVSEVC
jgi:hypothetical protein